MNTSRACNGKGAFIDHCFYRSVLRIGAHAIGPGAGLCEYCIPVIARRFVLHDRGSGEKEATEHHKCYQEGGALHTYMVAQEEYLQGT
jgi:hypothetical protein